MATTLEQVRAALTADEPRYPQLAGRFGPAAFPFLEQLAGSPDALLAAKAASLAAAIGGAGAEPVLAVAAQRPEIGPRAAAAHGARSLPPAAAEKVLLLLVEDREPAVAKHAVRAAAAVPTPALRNKLQALTGPGVHATVVAEAREALRQMPAQP